MTRGRVPKATSSNKSSRADKDQPLHIQLGTDDPIEQAQRVYALRQMALVSPITVLVQYDQRSDTVLVSPIGQAKGMTVLEMQQFLLIAQQKLVQALQESPVLPTAPPDQPKE